MIQFFAASFLMFVAGCASTTNLSPVNLKSPPTDAKPARAIIELTTSASCLVFKPGEEPLEVSECVESVTSDGTLILKPAMMKVVESGLTGEKKSGEPRHLWLRTANPSPNKILNGPNFALVGKGPSGVNLARQVAFFDHGPDFFEGGLARSIAKNGKVGFIDESLTTVIREDYDFAAPFKEGLTVACNGCTSDGVGEHPNVVGGDWLILNKFGKILKGPGLSQTEVYQQLEKLKAPKSSMPPKTSPMPPDSKAPRP